MPQDAREDLEIRVHKQRHGEERFPVSRPNRDPLLHAGDWPHQRSLDHLPETPSMPSTCHFSASNRSARSLSKKHYAMQEHVRLRCFEKVLVQMTKDHMRWFENIKRKLIS